MLVVTGAWVKRYLIIIPTLGSPYLPAQGLPWEWAHYRPSWVEWAITAGGFAGFLLIYTILSKLFPIVSIWETRPEAVEEPEAQVAMAPVRRRWGSAGTAGVLLIAGVLLGARSVQAQAQQVISVHEPEPGKKPTATSLSVEWQPLTEAETPPVREEEAASAGASSGRVFLFPERILGLINGAKAETEKKSPRPIAVRVTLRDEKGLPLVFQAVVFSLKASLGVVRFGSRPTDGQGRAQVILRDRRYGQYPVEVSYRGDETHKESSAEVLVDFGPRPAPGLPDEGVLITPYATAAIGLPFLVFYGTIWAVFFYAFGYLVLWRMRRSA